jgi:hypothetical protein
LRHRRVPSTCIKVGQEGLRGPGAMTLDGLKGEARRIGQRSRGAAERVKSERGVKPQGGN